MKKNRYMALTLAGLLCVGLLSGCGSKDNEEDNAVASPSPTPAEEKSTGSLTGTAEGTYAAGMVLSVDGSQLTLQLYAPTDDAAQADITDPADFQPADYALSQDTLMVAVDDESILRTPDETAGGTLTLADLKPGSILLVRQDGEDGAPTDVVVENAGTLSSDRLAQISTVGDSGLEVTWYQSDDPESVITSYSDINPNSYVLGTDAEALTTDDSTTAYLLRDGLLEQVELSDLTAGALVVVSLSSDGQALQIVVLDNTAVATV